MADRMLTHCTVTVGRYSVQKHSATYLVEAAYHIAILRATLQEELKIRHGHEH